MNGTGCSSRRFPPVISSKVRRPLAERSSYARRELLERSSQDRNIAFIGIVLERVEWLINAPAKPSFLQLLSCFACIFWFFLLASNCIFFEAMIRTVLLKINYYLDTFVFINAINLNECRYNWRWMCFYCMKIMNDYEYKYVLFEFCTYFLLSDRLECFLLRCSRSSVLPSTAAKIHR